MKHTMFRIPAFLALATLACGGPAPGDSSPETVFPAAPQVDVWLAITDTIGVETGDSSLVFGNPVTALRLENGGTAVLDFMKCRVSVFNGNGALELSFGRQGSGPGEFLMPSWLSLTPSGGFVVSDAGARRLFFFDPLGNQTGYMGNFFPSPPENGVFTGDSVFVARMTAYETQGEEMLAGFQVARWTVGNFDEEVVYFIDLKPFNLMDIGSSEAGQPVFTASEDGMVYTSVLSTDEFTIRFHNPDGTELFTIEEPFTRVSKTPEEVEAEREYLHDLFRRNGAPEEMIESMQPEEYRYALTSLAIGPQGNLWAGTGVYGFPLFRVYHRETGEFLYTAALETGENTGELMVFVNQWGFTALPAMSGEWPRVYVLDILE